MAERLEVCLSLLVLAELDEAMIQEIVERRAGLLRRHRVVKRVAVADGLGELRAHVVLSTAHGGTRCRPRDGRNPQRNLPTDRRLVLSLNRPFAPRDDPVLSRESPRRPSGPSRSRGCVERESRLRLAKHGGPGFAKNQESWACTSKNSRISSSRLPLLSRCPRLSTVREISGVSFQLARPRSTAS